MEKTYRVILLILLVYSTYTDLKKREIMMIPINICFFIGLFEVFIPSFDKGCSLTGIIPGGIILLISHLSKGAIGEGDAYLLMVVGMMMGLTGVMYIIIISSLISALYSGVNLITRKKELKDSIPYAPFILSGFLGVVAFA